MADSTTSRSGVGGYYRYSPRKISDLYEAMRAAADKAGKQPGTLVPKIHESVFGRIKVGAHLYAPIGLPADYEVVTTGDVRLGISPAAPFGNARSTHDNAKCPTISRRRECI